MKALFASTVSILFAASTLAAPPPPYEFIGEPTLNGQRLPFSDAVRVGDILVLSGEIGRKPDGTLPEGIEAQARQTMENIGAKLKAQGLGWGDVLKCTVMLDNMAEWPAFNSVYVTYFKNNQFPARSAFGVDGLALGALVEVECWAHARYPRRDTRIEVWQGGDDGLTNRFVDAYRKEVSKFAARAITPMKVTVDQIMPKAVRHEADRIDQYEVMIAFERKGSSTPPFSCTFVDDAFQSCLSKAVETTRKLAESGS